MGSLPADVVVGEVQACDTAQYGDLLRKASDLIVSELEDRDRRQRGQMFWLQLLDLVVPTI